MDIENKDIIKSYFVTGAKPTEEQFATLIDSFLHIDELSNLNLIKATDAEAQEGISNDRYMTPIMVKTAIGTLVRLANIPELANEVQTKVDAAITNLMRSDDSDNVINTLKEVFDFVKGLSEGEHGLMKLLNNKENAFSKNTAFNKTFGTGAGQVAKGNHSHLLSDLNGILGKSDAPTVDNSYYLATSKAVYRVNDKVWWADKKAVEAYKKAVEANNREIPEMPSWYNIDSGSLGTGQDLLQVICAGKINADGSRQDWWGKDRIRKLSFF